MDRNLKRMLTIIISTCLVISMYHGEIVAMRPHDREDYAPALCEDDVDNKDNKGRTSGSVGLKKKIKLC